MEETMEARLPFVVKGLKIVSHGRMSHPTPIREGAATI